MPKTRLGDGLSIDRFIPPQLRSMFYKNPTATAKYAIHDGLDPYGFSTNGLVLYLPLWALKDSTFKSVDAYKHSCAVTGALWIPDGHSFDGADDLIDLGTDASLTITGNLTLMFWVKLDVTLANQPDTNAYVIAKQVSGFATCNYRLTLSKGSAVYDFLIRDAAGSAMLLRVNNIDATGLDDLKWHHVAAVWDRTGATKGYIYEDAVEISGGGVAGTDGDPYTAGSHVTCIGGHSAEADVFLDGSMGEAWIFNKALSAAEVLHHYNATSFRYR